MIHNFLISIFLALIFIGSSFGQSPVIELSTLVGPRGVHREQLKFVQSDDQFYDFRKTVVIANESGSQEDKYPLTIRFSNVDVSLLGATVVGVQPESLTWNEMKSNFDGDAIRIEVNGYKSADSCYLYNVQDGFSPHGEYGWRVANCWIKNVRDDAIENDSLLSGTADNTLFDGVFMFLSARPGDNTTVPENFIDPTVRINDCLIHVKGFPDNNPKTRFTDGNGNACGQFFKWSEHAGKVEVNNTIFRIDHYASRGSSPMNFVAGEYNNCTLVWLGEGDYPQPIPPGVTVTTDISVWHNARTEWIIENSWRFPNRHLLQELD